MDHEPSGRLSPKIWILITAGLLLFLGANAHLLYVAFESQSACVPHLKESTGEAGKFKAAKSGC